MAEQKYIVSDGMARAIVWIGAVGYTISLLTYVFKVILFQFNDNAFEDTVKYSFLVVGFLFLSVSTIRKALEVQIDRKDMEKPEFLFRTLTRMGWACLAMHFVSLYVLPHHTHVYYVIALVGYFALAMGQKLGVYLNVLFYMISSVFMFLRPVVDYAVFPSKVVNMIYMGAYAYIFARQYLDRKKEKKET
jgi:hypothetical protein